MADSLEQARPGELVYVDGRGRVRSRAQTRVRNAGALVLLGGIVAGLFALGPLYGVVGVVGGAFGYAREYRWRSAYARACALADAGELSEALEAVKTLERAAVPARFRPHVQLAVARVRWWAGDHDAALDGYESAIRGLERLRGGKRSIWYRIAQYHRISLLASTGRVDQALADRPDDDEASEGELHDLHRVFSDLVLAFYSGDDRLIADDETLHDQGTRALRSNVLGSVLVLVSWAFERRGDTDLARHLLGEAVPRMHNDRLQSIYPELHAWMTDRLATWNDG